MCERLNRCFQAFDILQARKRDGHKIPQVFVEDTSHGEAYLEQHMVLCAIQPSEFSSEKPIKDLTIAPLDAVEYQLLSALIETEKFMRFSAREIAVFKGIVPDEKSSLPIPEAALCWIKKAIDLANQFRQALDPDGTDYRCIALQDLMLTPTTDVFIRLLSHVRSCERVWKGRNSDLWRWPDKKSIENEMEHNFCCSKIDIIIELEEVQRLLKLQDDSQDRLRRSNCSTARKVINKAFEKSSKVLVIRIDLGFKNGSFERVPVKSCGAESDGVRDKFILLKKYFSVFIRYLNKEFKDALLGYFAKMEYGPKRGVHYHLLIAINGHKHQQDINLAKKIGEHWAGVVTSGSGYYHNCNAMIKSYKFYGSGMIHRTDVLKRSFLDDYVIDYLLKYNLPFQIIKKFGFRQFSASSRN